MRSSVVRLPLEAIAAILLDLSDFDRKSAMFSKKCNPSSA